MVLSLRLKGGQAGLDLRAPLLEDPGLVRHRSELRPEAAEFLRDPCPAGHELLHPGRDLLGGRVEARLLPLVPLRPQGVERFREFREVLLNPLRGRLRVLEPLPSVREIFVGGLELDFELLPLRLQGARLHVDGPGLPAVVLELSLEVEDVLPDLPEPRGDVLRLGLDLPELLPDLLDLAGARRAELEGGPLRLAAHHGPARLDELPTEGHEPDAAHPLPGLVQGLDDEGVPEDVEECVPVLLLELAEVDREAEALLRDEDRLAPRLPNEHLVEREERRAADLPLLEEVDALRGDPVVVDDDRLHPRTRRGHDGRLVPRVHVGELGHGPVDPLDRPRVPGLENRGDGPGVPAAHVLRDVGLGLELPELPVCVVELDLVALPGGLDLADLRLQAGHGLLRPVPLEDEPLELVLDCVRLLVEGDDLLLDREDFRVNLRRDLVDLLEVLVRRLQGLVELRDPRLDLPALPLEGLDLLEGLHPFLRGVPGLGLELPEDLLRRLDPVRRARPLDPQGVEPLLELFRLLPAPVRHLLLQLGQASLGRLEPRSELLLLGQQLLPVRLVLGYLLPGPGDLGLDELPVLVRELGPRGREAFVELLVLQGALPVRFELGELPLDLLEDDPDPLEVLLRLPSLAFCLGDVVIELRDPRDVVEDPPAVHVRHGDDLLDVPLLDEVVPLRGDPPVGEEAVELREGRLPVVDVEVGVVAALHGGAQADVSRELDLVRLDGDRPVRVVEQEADLAGSRAFPFLPAVPDEVRELARADRLRALRAEHEKDRVGDVALARAVRPRDRRIALEEGNRDLAAKGLEVLHLDFFQVQRSHPLEGR